MKIITILFFALLLSGATLAQTPIQTALTVFKIDGTDLVYKVEYRKAQVEKIAPESIESISVLKDDAALREYGKDASDGVIVITLNKTAFEAMPEDFKNKFEHSQK